MSNHKNNFTTNVLKMATAPILTQIISFFSMPLIARLFSPAMFGIYNLYSSIIDPICSISTLGYHQAIVLPKKENHSINILFTSLFITLFSCVIVFFTYFLVPVSFLNKINFDLIETYKWFIPISVAIHGFNSTFTGWNQRNAKFTTIASSRISHAFVNKLFLVIIGLIGFASTGMLIIGFIFGSFIMLIIQISPFILFIFKNKTYTTSLNEIKYSIKKYKKFPIFIMTSDFVYRLSSSVIMIMLIYFFSEDVAGHYGMAIMMTSIPTILIGTAIGEVFYAKAATEYGKKNSKQTYLNLITKLVRMSVFVFFLIGIISTELFSFIFGDAWIEAGRYTTLLCFRIFISFITAPIANIVKIIDKQEYALIVEIIVLIFSIISIYIGSIYNNIYLAVGLLSILIGAVTLLYALLIFKFVLIKPLSVVKIILKEIIYALPFTVPILLAKYFLFSKSILILLVALSSLIIHYVFIFNRDEELKSICFQLFYKFSR